jgi:uncharacterized protein (DUF1810 family)
VSTQGCWSGGESLTRAGYRRGVSVHLERFVEAQDGGHAYERAIAELRAGRKTGHWMWFVFPQLAGLGRSHMSQRFAISSLDEARAYLAHPVLGPRLIECAATLAAADSPAEEILGTVDAMKLRSCMTLFARAATKKPVFGEVLTRHFDGADPLTLELLARSG